MTSFLEEAYFYDSFSHFISTTKILKNTQIKNQYLELLSYLTKVEPMSNEDFLSKIDEISRHGEIILCYCIKDNIITFVGSGTIFIEPKLIRGTRSVGHIEDIVVHPLYRGKGMANKIVESLMDYARINNCYKTILDCDPVIKKVYEKAGMKEKGIQMAHYL